MGNKKFMKTFFTAMNEAVVPTKGYGAKVVSTPMGPFSWNETLQAWVNNNNGMQMNNISFQDMNAMMDYGVSDGEKNNSVVSPVLRPTEINTLLFSPTTQSFDIVTSSGLDLAITPLFNISGNTNPIFFKWVLVSGSMAGAVIKYRKNGGAISTGWPENNALRSPNSVISGDTFEMYLNVTLAAATTAVIRLINVTDSNTICSNDLTIQITSATSSGEG
jgi:hypothetical protein